MIEISNISDTELFEKLHRLKSHQQIAQLLGVSQSTLIYQLYRNPAKYRTFTVSKKNGDQRRIMAPNPVLKHIQRSLAAILTRLYKPTEGAHGFIKNRSIVTNAKVHEGQAFVINLDLKDFFPSITFQRVAGLFMGAFFQIPPEGARILAYICCEEQFLPQGAPTSPIISNFICRRLDRELLGFAEDRASRYSRYVDDITISTKMSRVLPFILNFDEDNVKVYLEKELLQIIEQNGFRVNPSKVRLQTGFTHQEVTGIVVNHRLNVSRKLIRQVRAMLHALNKFGPELAEEHFFRYYDIKRRKNKEDQPSFEIVLRGKIEFIGMVRGKEDAIYKKFLRELTIIRLGYLKLRRKRAG